MKKVVPVVTPFTDDARSISEVRVGRMVRQCLSSGFDSLFLLGEIGEYMTLSTSERKTFVEIIARDGHAQVNFLVNVSSPSTSKSLDLAQHAARHGAQSAVITPLERGTYTQEEQILHIRTVGSFSNLRTVVLDPLMILTSGAQESLTSISNLSIAEAQSFENWSSFAGECHLKNLFSAFSDPESREDWDLAGAGLVRIYGSAPVAKGALEKFGFEVGSLRSPKLAAPFREIERAFSFAA